MKGTPGEGILPRAIKTYIDIIVRERTKDLNITPSCCITLCCVADNEGCSLQELSKYMWVDKSLVTRNVKQLVESGLIENRNSFKNKYSLYLTEKGNKANKHIKEIVGNVWEDIFSVLTDEEIESFNSISIKIAKRMEDLIAECEKQ